MILLNILVLMSPRLNEIEEGWDVGDGQMGLSKDAWVHAQEIVLLSTFVEQTSGAFSFVSLYYILCASNDGLP